MDNYAAAAERNGTLSHTLQTNCYEACAEETEFTFLTLNEGLCVRNCITKFGVVMAAVK